MFFFKKLFNSTALGLTAGVLLAGYAVFAYTPPTQAPPGGNVLAPLNVGSGSQVKSGGLWVGSLGVDGGVQVGGSIKVGGFATLPVCGTTEKGTFVFNTTAGNPYVCDGSVWKVVSAGIDNDGDGVTTPTDCNDDNANIYQNVASLVTDADNDSYPTATAAATQCVGTTSVINTRTYYKNASAAFTWCSSSVCSTAIDQNDANASIWLPPTKTCPVAQGGTSYSPKSLLERDCGTYCTGFNRTVSCSQIFTSNCDSPGPHCGVSDGMNFSNCEKGSVIGFNGTAVALCYIPGSDYNGTATCTCS